MDKPGCGHDVLIKAPNVFKIVKTGVKFIIKCVLFLIRCGKKQLNCVVLKNR